MRQRTHITFLVQTLPPRTSGNVPSSDDEILHVEFEVRSVIDLLGHSFQA